MPNASFAWPHGKRFAFTIVDDTDGTTVEKVGPVYDFLFDHGFRTTKTVWPLAPIDRPVTGGSTLEDPAYRDWILTLRDRGFEIASHGTTDHSSTRERILAGLECFRQVLGEDPRLHANHTGQRESIYWGDARLDGIPRSMYRLVQALRGRNTVYAGHDERSERFWGDLCQERITYVRNFVFRDINTLKCDPRMPYRDPRRPYVRYWFSASEGAVARSFCATIAEANQDRLVEEGGACIMYAHLAHGFLEGKGLAPRFVQLMKRLAALPGWFVPASELLDYLRSRPGWTPEADPRHTRRLQWRWLAIKLAHSTS